ncbi:uncharacterized protein ARMOST_03159 [Armillaria ostoyae]|uniref:Uncharacterized protein n=1 Tax=Armillaria ostoyae TaxID=47428 RepID=A0A284QTP5_ARMOS|nr:uncharacterized protein ARMOST_03159 [Armillaria ostoyae]
MVKAVRLGVPSSYTTFIANQGENIPQTYSEWKHRITNMYDEQQKKWAFDQVIGAQRDTRDHCPPQKGPSNTATSTSQKAGGTTSSSSGKLTSNSANTGG